LGSVALDHTYVQGPFHFMRAVSKCYDFDSLAHPM
jgi:hypothetical protein